jgi:hypothetical protein
MHYLATMRYGLTEAGVLSYGLEARTLAAHAQ